MAKIQEPVCCGVNVSAWAVASGMARTATTMIVSGTTMLSGAAKRCPRPTATGTPAIGFPRVRRAFRPLAILPAGQYFSIHDLYFRWAIAEPNTGHVRNGFRSAAPTLIRAD